jgi:hypothetical protein
MPTRKLDEARKALDGDLDGITSDATEKELDHPWIPQSQARAEMEAIRPKPHTAAQDAQIARIAALLEKTLMPDIRADIKALQEKVRDRSIPLEDRAQVVDVAEALITAERKAIGLDD